MDDREPISRCSSFACSRAGRERRAPRRRSELLEQLWETPAGVDVRSVDSGVERLREKTGPARGLLQTVRGIGYRLAAPVRPAEASRTHPLDAASAGGRPFARG